MASSLMYPAPAQALPILNSDSEMGPSNTLKVPTPNPLQMRSRARRRRSSSKSSSLDTNASLSSFSSQSIVSSPNIVITRRGSLSKNQPVFTFKPKGHLSAHKMVKRKRKTKRRRIRTFYSNGRWEFDFSKAKRVDPKFPVNLCCGGPSSPIPLPKMDRQHLSVDLEFGDSLSCDSAASNMAANNDLDRRMADDEDDDFSDLEVPDLPKKRDSQFKIVVSAPGTMDVMDSRVTAKRAQSRRFCGSDIDCDTDDCGSSESESESMIFSDNDSRMGIFASFPGADVESEYLSAQSDDFDDLAICFRRDRRDRNIRFRRQNAPKYLNVGQSDMGSDDTECFSSDSITDMMPPTVSPIQFVPMVAR